MVNIYRLPVRYLSFISYCCKFYHSIRIGSHGCSAAVITPLLQSLSLSLGKLLIISIKLSIL